jgi:hypothetical protein
MLAPQLLPQNQSASAFSGMALPTGRAARE